MVLVIVLITIVLIILIISVWVAYSITAAYQETLSVTVNFNNTYRYINMGTLTSRYKLDSVKITVTGSIKKNTGLITTGQELKNAINDILVEQYTNTLLVHESDTFNVESSFLEKDDDGTLKRSPLSKTPTLENLTILFFNKLSESIYKLDAQLVSLKLYSEDIEVTRSKYKISNYTI